MYKKQKQPDQPPDKGFPDPGHNLQVFFLPAEGIPESHACDAMEPNELTFEQPDYFPVSNSMPAGKPPICLRSPLLPDWHKKQFALPG